MKCFQRAALCLIAPAQPLSVLAAFALVTSYKHALTCDVLSEIRLQSGYGYVQRLFQIGEVVIDGLMFIAGVAVNRHDAFSRTVL